MVAVVSPELQRGGITRVKSARQRGGVERGRSGAQYQDIRTIEVDRGRLLRSFTDNDAALRVAVVGMDAT